MAHVHEKIKRPVSQAEIYGWRHIRFSAIGKRRSSRHQQMGLTSFWYKLENRPKCTEACKCSIPKPNRMMNGTERIGWFLSKYYGFTHEKAEVDERHNDGSTPGTREMNKKALDGCKTNVPHSDIDIWHIQCGLGAIQNVLGSSKILGASQEHDNCCRVTHLAFQSQIRETGEKLFCSHCRFHCTKLSASSCEWPIKTCRRTMLMSTIWLEEHWTVNSTVSGGTHVAGSIRITHWFGSGSTLPQPRLSSPLFWRPSRTAIVFESRNNSQAYIPASYQLTVVVVQ